MIARAWRNGRGEAVKRRRWGPLALALAVSSGCGDAPDRSLAEAARAGDAGAQFALGVVYAEGDGVQENDDRAARWFRDAAEQGHAAAAARIGWMYAEGVGVERDDALAVGWLRVAAEGGDPSGQFRLGFSHDHALAGLDEDDVEAFRWYLAAAERGHPSAQRLLGRMYDRGEGVRADQLEAVRWTRAAAERGDALARYDLGLKYANGDGVPKSDVHAYAWTNLAASEPLSPYWIGPMFLAAGLSSASDDGAWDDFPLGPETFAPARDLKKRLKARMSPAEIARAQDLSLEWAGESR